MLQIPENKFAVCQAQKQVKCERAQEGDKCRAEKQVTTKATCEYSAEMWEAGGTCIIDVLAKAQEVKLKESNGDLTKTAWGRRRKKAQGHHAKKTWGRRRKKAQGHHVKKAWVQYAKRLRAKAIASARANRHAHEQRAREKHKYRCPDGVHKRLIEKIKRECKPYDADQEPNQEAESLCNPIALAF